MRRMNSLSASLQAEAVLNVVSREVCFSSAIAGEPLNGDQVRSAVARRLGAGNEALTPAGPDVEGAVGVELDAMQKYQEPLTAPRLFGWHAALFPAGHNGNGSITVGAWREGNPRPMRAKSRRNGQSSSNFAPAAAERLPGEMALFLEWFNGPVEIDPVLKAAVAHLRFMTLQPFDAGNGWIARAITNLALARSDQSPNRFYGMSAQISVEYRPYCRALERAQRGSLEITAWNQWFLRCLNRALHGSEVLLASVMRKARFWALHASDEFNDRQRKMLDHLLEADDARLSSSKWATLSMCSQDSAHRDIMDLIRRGIMAKSSAGGRSTRYALCESLRSSRR